MIKFNEEAIIGVLEMNVGLFVRVNSLKEDTVDEIIHYFAAAVVAVVGEEKRFVFEIVSLCWHNQLDEAVDDGLPVCDANGYYGLNDPLLWLLWLKELRKMENLWACDDYYEL